MKAIDKRNKLLTYAVDHRLIKLVKMLQRCNYNESTTMAPEVKESLLFEDLRVALEGGTSNVKNSDVIALTEIWKTT